jgi:hypothetical protein
VVRFQKGFGAKIAGCRTDPPGERQADVGRYQVEALERRADQHERRACGERRCRHRCLGAGLSSQQARQLICARRDQDGGLELQHLPIAGRVLHGGDVGPRKQLSRVTEASGVAKRHTQLRRKIHSALGRPAADRG